MNSKNLFKCRKKNKVIWNLQKTIIKVRMIITSRWHSNNNNDYNAKTVPIQVVFSIGSLLLFTHHCSPESRILLILKWMMIRVIRKMILKKTRFIQLGFILIYTSCKDIVRPLHKNEAGNMYILSIQYKLICYATRVVLTTSDVATVTQSLVECFSYVRVYTRYLLQF